MADFHRNTDEKRTSQKGYYAYNHPLKWMFYLIMAGIGLLFLVLLVLFTVTAKGAKDFTEHAFPEAFTVSTVVLLLSGFFISRCESFFREDYLIRLKKYLMLTLILGLTFSVTQVIGWQHLMQTGIKLSGHAAGAYLYLVSGLHLAHLAGGIIFLIHVLWVVHKSSADEIRSLVYVTDYYQKVKLQVLVRYWIFMDFLWTVLFFYFLFWF